jgi:dihydroxyacetone kinase
VRAQPKDASKVAIVTLGGSGHEPALSGFVGEGMLDISVVGEYLTVQEMAGFQMFVAKMDDELLQLWDAPCDTPYLTVR